MLRREFGFSPGGRGVGGCGQGKPLMQFPQKYGGLAHGGLAFGMYGGLAFGIYGGLAYGGLFLRAWFLGAWLLKARQILACSFYETECNSAKWLNPQHVLNTYSTNNELYYVIEKNL